MMPLETLIRRHALLGITASVVAVLLTVPAYGNAVPGKSNQNQTAQPVEPPVAAQGSSSGVVLVQADIKPAEPMDADDTALIDDEYEVLIIQALDQKTNLEVEETPILEAIERLAENTGISIGVDPRTLGLLPYGSKTVMSATIKDRSLREALMGILRPLGLTFRIDPQQVMIVPTPALQRIVRRATWDELEVLERLNTTPWSRELFDSLQFQFQDGRTGDYDENRDTLLRLCQAIGKGTMADVLENACDQYGWAWYPSGEFIAILSKTRQVERQLEKRVTLRYGQSDLEQVLLDLGHLAGVLLHMDPGVLASVPPQMAERFSLSIENATIRQILEVVAGQTGLGYFIEPTGVRLTANTLAPPSSNGSAGGDAAAEIRALRSNMIVGQVTVPNGDGSSFAFFVRQNDLPPEVNQLREAKIKSAVNAMRRALLAEQPQD